jgi:hypothetical protein
MPERGPALVAASRPKTGSHSRWMHVDSVLSGSARDSLAAPPDECGADALVRAGPPRSGLAKPVKRRPTRASTPVQGDRRTLDLVKKLWKQDTSGASPIAEMVKATVRYLLF